MREIASQNQEFNSVGSDEDLARATLYGLLARLLSEAPDQQTLEILSSAQGGDGDVGAALKAVTQAARVASAAAVAEEYQDLFIGLGRGELLPFGSYYLTGFLQEKPLAKLRRDMANLGVKAKEACSDPEDHVASVLEVMGGLIDGRFGGSQGAAGQRAFFDAHIATWMPVFFRDLEQAKAAEFYRTVGRLGRAFVEIESAQFEMAA